MTETATQGALPRSDTRIVAIIVYGLYLIGWPCLHMTSIAGLIVAYLKRDEARGTVWESHFENQIRTFWITLALLVVGIPLCFVVVGIPIVLGAIVCSLYRSIKGLLRAIDEQPYG
jgi:uncharacterized membrane protein